ncbi:MAG: NACHT domain-containing protein [Cellulomonas sp.]
MEPFTSGVVIGAVANFASSAVVGAARFIGRPRVGDDLAVEGPMRLLTWDLDLEVSAADAERISRLLQDSYVEKLVEAHAFARFFAAVEKEQSPGRYFLSELETAFVETGKEFIGGDRVDEVLIALWGALTSGIETVVERLDVPALLDEEELRFLGRLEPIVRVSSGRVRPPRFLRELASMLADRHAIESTLSVMQDVRDAYRHQFSQMSLEHTIEGGRSEGPGGFQFEQMYIERSAMNRNNDTVKVDKFLTGSHRSRFVVLGDPGAGKSTLMQHVARIRSQDETGVPILLRIREIGAEKPVLIEEIVATLRRDLQLHSIDALAVERMPILGRATVIFDGLDEAGDVPNRLQMTKAINAFVKQYPLASYLVTSRAVGYGQASLGSSFPSLSLIEFSDEEIMEYTRRWFGGNGGERGGRRGPIWRTRIRAGPPPKPANALFGVHLVSGSWARASQPA